MPEILETQKYNVYDFICWALKHAHRDGLIKSAIYPLSSEEIGKEPWEYLYGSVRVKTDQPTLDRYYTNHYANSMTRAEYDSITANWDRNGYATDCGGLLDAFFTYECDDKRDWNADMYYNYGCSDKGSIKTVDRNYVIGEALFTQSDNRMSHIGFVCGFTDSGDALAIEARNIRYGVVITKVKDRNWTHRGLLKTFFSYTETEPTVASPVVLKHTQPMMTGEHIKAVQIAMNALNYLDASGKQLEEDGKCGKRTMEAVTAFASAHAPIEEAEPITVEVPALPPVVKRLDFEAEGLTLCAFRSADMPTDVKS